MIWRMEGKERGKKEIPEGVLPSPSSFLLPSSSGSCSSLSIPSTNLEASGETDETDGRSSTPHIHSHTHSLSHCGASQLASMSLQNDLSDRHLTAFLNGLIRLEYLRDIGLSELEFRTQIFADSKMEEDAIQQFLTVTKSILAQVRLPRLLVWRMSLSYTSARRGSTRMMSSVDRSVWFRLLTLPCVARACLLLLFIWMGGTGCLHECNREHPFLHARGGQSSTTAFLPLSNRSLKFSSSAVEEQERKRTDPLT